MQKLPTKQKNYLSNKDILAEIHKSKTSYCEFENQEDSTYDHIVESIDDMFYPESIRLAKEQKANRIKQQGYEDAMEKFMVDNTAKIKPKLAEFAIDPESLLTENLVFRVLTYDHIPQAPGRKKNPKTVADLHVKLNFVPFKHYKITDPILEECVEVGRSHWDNGNFSLEHGAMTDKLATMFMLLVERYSQRTNWRGYSYVSEMKGQALLQLSQVGLQFKEEKSSNPFSYFTAVITNCFRRVLNSEKRHQNIRDDILQEQGKNPSYSRQLDHEDMVTSMRNEVEEQKD